MTNDSPPPNSPDELLEGVLQQDEHDITPFTLGVGEQHVATTLLFLATLPSVAIPSLSKIFNKTTQFTLLLSTAFLVGLYFVIQYRFHWILQLTHTLQQIYYERIRI